MEIRVRFSMLGRVFMMPASVVDEYIKISTGEQIKVLLCIYCLGSEAVDTKRIADMSGVSEQGVREAVIHFSKLGVFAAEGITGAENTTTQPVSPTEKADEKPSQELKLIGQAEAIKGTSRDTSRDARVRYTPKEIAAKIDADKALSDLMQSMEALAGRQLTHSNIGDILEMYEHLELDPACILMIAEYCKSLGKCKSAYILSVARDWFDEGISEFDSIERKIISLTTYNSFEAKIKRLIGLTSSVTKKQKGYIQTWQDMGFGFDMVQLAYEENIDNTGKLSFAYINKILEEWHKKGIRTPAAAAAEKERFRSQKPVAPEKSGIAVNEVDDFARSIDFDKVKL